MNNPSKLYGYTWSCVFYKSRDETYYRVSRKVELNVGNIVAKTIRLCENQIVNSIAETLITGV